MQWFLSALVWVVMVGGVALFIAARHPPEAAVARALSASERTVSLRLTTTGALGGEVDPFAASSQAAADAVTITATGADETVYRRRIEHLRPGESVHVADLPSQVIGRNVLTIDTAEPDAATALRVELLVDGHAAREELLWLSPGARGQARVDFRLAADESDEHAHD